MDRNRGSSSNTGTSSNTHKTGKRWKLTWDKSGVCFRAKRLLRSYGVTLWVSGRAKIPGRCFLHWQENEIVKDINDTHEFYFWRQKENLISRNSVRFNTSPRNLKSFLSINKKINVESCHFYSHICSWWLEYTVWLEMHKYKTLQPLLGFYDYLWQFRKLRARSTLNGHLGTTASIMATIQT